MSDEKPGDDEAPPAESKRQGKSKEDPENTTPSFAARLGSSASSLSRDLFAGGPSSSTAGLASSLATSEKARQAGLPSSSSAAAESSTWAQDTQTRPYGNTTTNGSPALQEGFRSSDNSRGQNVNSELEQGGFLNYARGGPLSGPDITSMLGVKPDWRPSAWVNMPAVEDGYRESAVGDQRLNGAGDDVSTAQMSDGMDVVNILNDPTALGDASMLEADFKGAEEVSADDLFNEPMSQGELDIKGKMKATLPPPVEHGTIDPNHANNLRPDVEMLHMPQSAAEGGLSLPRGSTVDSFASQAAREEWMRQWLDEWDNVLHNYTDEVWGPSLPRVEEARREIQEMKKDKDLWHDKQAVRRLEMVLRHISVPARN